MLARLQLALWNDDPLVKSMKKAGAPLGYWQNLAIIAIGPKGGKIIGYGKFMKPIYAGSAQAHALSQQKAQKAAKEKKGKVDPDTEAAVHAIVEWLSHLGFSGTMKDGDIVLAEEDGKAIGKALHVLGQVKDGKIHFKPSMLYAHVGEPLIPPAHEASTILAAAASGQLDEDLFPRLSELKQIPTTGNDAKYAGSHGNLLFVDKNGRKWIFKATDPTIARAEEAACRIGRLLLGDAVQPAKVVTIGGQLGVLVGEMPGDVWQEASSMHSHPPLAHLKKYAPQIVQHEILDWLISNHDGHAGQFLANGDQVVAIDKGQAWKWIGTDDITPGWQGSNPSTPIYGKFWSQVKAGKIPSAGLIDAAREFLERWGMMTEEQFRAIIDPYVQTVAAWKKVSPESIAEKLVSRFTELQEDVEQLLSTQLGQQVSFGVLHPPEEALPTEPVHPTIPEEPAVEPPKAAVAPPKAEPKLVIPPGGGGAPGASWKPLTKGSGKGTTTLVEPGQPPEAGWPEGIPGKGTIFEVNYQKKLFTMTVVQKGGKPLFVVKYPDGQVQEFTSANGAGDSLYLFIKDMPLDMTATEKKAKGISLGSKVFKFKEFQPDIEAFHASGGVAAPAAAPVPEPAEVIATATPAELEEQKVVEPAQKELTLEDTLKKVPDYSVMPANTLPPVVQEFADKHAVFASQETGSALAAGMVVKLTRMDGTPFLLCAGMTIHGVLYFPFHNLDGEWKLDIGKLPTIYDTAFDLHKHFAKPVPKAPKEPEAPAGPPPEVTLPAEAKVPENAPAFSSGPLKPGTTIKTVKKFHGGKSVDYELTATPEGKFALKVNGVDVGVFGSLSSAAIHVWAAGKGFKSPEQYKEKTGKELPKSGFSWKWWGIETPSAEEPTAEPTPGTIPAKPAVPEPAPAKEGLAFSGKTIADHKKVAQSLPIGALVTMMPGNWPAAPAVNVIKTSKDTWQTVSTETKKLGSHVYTNGAFAIQIALAFKEGATVTNIEAPHLLPGAPKEPGEDNFETMPEGEHGVPKATNGEHLKALQAAPNGTEITVAKLGQKYKKDPNGWFLVSAKTGALGGIVNPGWIANVMATAQEDGIAVTSSVPLGAKEPAAEKPVFDKVEDYHAHIPTLDAMPVGTVLKMNHYAGGGLQFKKHANGEWYRLSFYKNAYSDEATKTDYIADQLKKYQDNDSVIEVKYESEATTAPEKPAETEALKSFDEIQPDTLNVLAADALDKKTLLKAPAGTTIDLYSKPFKKDTHGNWISLHTVLTNDQVLEAIAKEKLATINVWKAKELLTPHHEGWEDVTPGSLHPLAYPDHMDVAFLDAAPEDVQIALHFTEPDNSGVLTAILERHAGNWVAKIAPAFISSKPMDSAKLLSDISHMKSKTKLSVFVFGPPKKSVAPEEPKPAPAPAPEVPETPEKAPGVASAGLKKLPAQPSTLELVGAPPGTKLVFVDAQGGKFIVQKNADKEWVVTGLVGISAAESPHAVGSFLSNWNVHDMIGDFNMHGEGVYSNLGAVPETAESNFETMPETESEANWETMPEGFPHEIDPQQQHWKKVANKLLTAPLGTKLEATNFTATMIETPEKGIVWHLVWKDPASGEDSDLPTDSMAVAIDTEPQPVKVIPPVKGGAPVKAPVVPETPVVSKKENWLTLHTHSIFEEKNADKIVDAIPIGTKIKIVKGSQWYILEKDSAYHWSYQDSSNGAHKNNPEGASSKMMSNTLAYMAKYQDAKDSVELAGVPPGSIADAIKEKEEASKPQVPEVPAPVGYVQHLMPLKEALKKHKTVTDAGGSIKVKAAPKWFGKGYKLVCLDGVDGAASVLKQLIQELGIDDSVHSYGVHTNYKGAYFYVKASVLETAVPALVPEELAQKDTKKKAKQQAKAAKVQAEIDKAFAVKKAQAAANKAVADKIGLWAKDHPPVTDTEALYVLAHFQKMMTNYYKPLFYARMEGSDVLLRPMHDNFGDAIDEGEWQSLMQTKYPGKVSFVETPLGLMAKISVQVIKDKLPAAETITGPDGKSYPAGTTFKTETQEIPIIDKLKQEPGFYKLKEHNSDPSLMMLKVAGQGDEQKAQIQAMVKKYGLTTSFPQPATGQSSYFHFVKKAELSKPGEVLKTVVPDIPPQPEPFHAAALPSAGSVGHWDEVGDNYSDFYSLETNRIPIYGHVIRMGKPGVLSNFQVQVRRVKDKNGKIHYEVMGELLKFKSQKASLTKTTLEIPSSASHLEPTTDTKILKYDPETGTHTEDGTADSIRSIGGYEGSTANGSTIQVYEDSAQKTFNGTFRVRIPEGQDVEKELAKAFALMGYNPLDAVAPIDETSDRIYKKLGIAQALLGAKGFGENDTYFPRESRHDEAALDAIIKKHGALDLLKTARVVRTFQGKVSVVVNDLSKFKKALFPYVGTKVLGAFLQILQGAGWASRRQRYIMGVDTAGQSPGEDQNNGGAKTTFFRIAAPGAEVANSYAIQVVFHPRIFQRTDWYHYNTDAYGNNSGTGTHAASFNHCPSRYDADHVTGTNEICFMDGVDLRDVVSFTAANKDAVQELIALCKKAGITEINGKPIEEMIIYSPDYDNPTKLAEKLGISDKEAF